MRLLTGARSGGLWMRRMGWAGLAAPLLALWLSAGGCGETQSAGPVSPGGASNVPGAPAVDLSQCDQRGKQVITADTNGDQKPDVWKFYVGGPGNTQILTCKQTDLNHDGKVDIIDYFDASGQNLVLEKFDLDFDGKLDMTVYYANGKKVREELDTNYDGKPDFWKYFEDDKLVRIERDANYDGRVDEWQYYENGKLDRIGYDTTGSGRVDKWDRSPEGEDVPGGGSPTAPSGPTTPGAPAAAPTSGPATSAAPAAVPPTAAAK